MRPWWPWVVTVETPPWGPPLPPQAFGHWACGVPTPQTPKCCSKDYASLLWKSERICINEWWCLFLNTKQRYPWAELQSLETWTSVPSYLIKYLPITSSSNLHSPRLHFLSVSPCGWSLACRPPPLPEPQLDSRVAGLVITHLTFLRDRQPFTWLWGELSGIIYVPVKLIPPILKGDQVPLGWENLQVKVLGIQK